MSRNVGSVFHYPYLWASERDEGRTTATKDRTACLLVRKKYRTAGGMNEEYLVLLGITDRPREGNVWVEVSHFEKKRAQLDPKRPAYVVVSEYNQDVLPHSYDYDAQSKTFGEFSPAFMDTVMRAFQTARLDPGVIPVPRLDDEELAEARDRRPAPRPPGM